MNKKILAAIAAVVAVCVPVGYWVSQSMAKTKYFESVTPAIKNTSLRVSNSIEMSYSKNQGITYGEFFQRLENDVKEVDKHVLDVQTLTSPSMAEQGGDRLVDYLKKTQSYLRSMSQTKRHEMKLSSATDRLTRAADGVIGANTYAIEYATKEYRRAKEEATKAIDELNKQVVSEKRDFDNFVKARKEIEPLLPADALPSPAIIEMAATAIEPAAEQAAGAVSKEPKEVDVSNSGIQAAIVAGKIRDALDLIRAKEIHLNHQNSAGNTALHLAATKGGKSGVEIVKALLEAGADKSIKNGNGKTALDLANEKKNNEIAALLR